MRARLLLHHPAAKWLRRTNRSIGQRALTPTPSAESAHAELAVFSQFLTKYTADEKCRIVCVAGDSTSLLSFIYQQLPAALSQSTAARGRERRLVTHELASKGLACCNDSQQYLTLDSTAATAEMAPTSLVQWYVPRIVAHVRHQDAFFALWTPPQPLSTAPDLSEHTQAARKRGRSSALATDDVCILLFLNTDVAEDNLFADGAAQAFVREGAGSRRLLPPRAETWRLTPEWGERILPAYFRATGDAKDDLPRGPAPASLPCAQCVPVLCLSSFSPFFDARRAKVLTAMEDGANPSVFFRHLFSAHTQSTLLPQHSAGGWRGGAVFTRAAVNHFVRPSIYGDEASLAEGLHAARRRNRTDSLVVENLHDVNALVDGTCSERERRPVVHRYYPLVSQLGELLQRDCCLSDVYVLEFRMKEDHPLFCEREWEQRPDEFKNGSVHRALYEATALFSLHPGKVTRQRLERCLGQFIEAACTARRAFTWPLGCEFGEEAPPRVAMCVTYEVFSRESVHELAEQERRLVREVCATQVGAGCMTAVLQEEDLPTTVGYLVKLLLAALRERGWILTHQESHHTWDSARAWAPREPRRADADITSPLMAVRQRVLKEADSTNVDKQSMLRQHQTWVGRRRGSVWPSRLPDGVARPPGKEEAGGRKTANGDFAHPTGFTSTELWRAAAMSGSAETDGLSLWKGCRVVLPNGRRGVVVGFAPTPEWAFQPAAPDSLRADDKHEQFTRWCRSQADTPFRWKPCLPTYVAETEQAVWPVVQFMDSKTVTLVLPSLVARHCVRYPTWCFVSEAQQQIMAASQQPAFTSEQAGSEPGAKECSGGAPLKSAIPATLDADGAREVCWPLRRGASHDGSDAGNVITTVALPLQVDIGVTPASLFYASVLLGGKGGTALWDQLPRTLPDSQALRNRQSLQRRWRELHLSRRRACLADGTMGAYAPTPLPLRSTHWQLRTATFARRPGALRCVVASVPDVDNVTLDNPSLLSIQRGDHPGVRR